VVKLIYVKEEKTSPKDTINTCALSETIVIPQNLPNI
jgi:hypothetical protein